MRRWSVQYSWPERAAAWEDGLQRDADEAARRDQEASLQQKVKDAKQFQRLGRALIAAGIKQDPDTGQIASLERAMVREGESLYTMGCELEERLAGVGSASGGLDRQARSLKRMSRRQVKALRDQLAERLAEVDAKLTGVDQRLLDTLERAEKILEKWPIEAVEDLAFQEPPPDISGGEIKL